MAETRAERKKASNETRQVEALERIARTIEEFPHTPLKAVLRTLEIQRQQATKAARQVDDDGLSCALEGWPALAFEVEYTADPDDLDRHITVKLNDRGIYFVFSEAGFLLDINTTKG